MNLEFILARQKIFSVMDRILSRFVKPSENILIFGFWRSGTTLLMEHIEKISHARSYFEPLLLSWKSM